MDWLCLMACGCYAANRWILAPRVASPFLHGHFADLLLIPAALPPVLWLQRRLGLRPDSGPPRWGEILLHLVVWSVLFEVLGPRVMAVTGDPWDVAAYTVGGVVAGCWWNRGRAPSRERERPAEGRHGF